MIQEQLYRSNSGNIVKLDLNRENIVHETTGGNMYTTNNKVNYCEGSNVIIHEKNIDNTIILDQVKIKVVPTTIYAEVNKRLISNTGMIFLPTRCSAQPSVCFSESATYIWDVSSYNSNCNFTFYKQASFSLVQDKVYVDQGNKILLRFPEIKTNTITCNDCTIFQSKEGIWVSERPVSMKLFRAISATLKWNITDTPNLHQMLVVSTNYLIYTFNNKLELSYNSVDPTPCLHP